MTRTFPHRIGNFVIYMLLTIITFGVYPLYYFFSRWDEQNDLLRQIAENTRAKAEAPQLRIVA